MLSLIHILELVFDESQKESDNEIWIDCYQLSRFLYLNRSEAVKVDDSKEWKLSLIHISLAWAFMFPGERCFEGTRTFTTQGIDKAVFNMFKIYGSLGNEKLSFESDGTKLSLIHIS